MKPKIHTLDGTPPYDPETSGLPPFPEIADNLEWLYLGKVGDSEQRVGISAWWATESSTQWTRTLQVNQSRTGNFYHYAITIPRKLPTAE